MSKILDSAVELNKIQYIAGNNTLNFTATPITGGSPIVDATAGVYANGAFAQANAAFQSANNVAPQVQPAFDKANAAFNKANSSVSRQSFLANTNQTLFITNGYNIGYVDVFVNGIKLYSAEDFTATDGANVSIITPVLTQNDVVEIINWGGTAEPIARVDQYARDYVNNAWSTANSAYNFANSVYGLANNAANSAASSIPLTGSANISGNLIPITSNTYYLGSSSNRWHSLYVGPGSIDLGGLILSNTNGTLSVSAPGAPATPIAGEDTWVRAQANAAFAAANSVNVYGANTTSNSYFAIPIGTTAERPIAPANGSIRYNTTLGRIEGYLYAGGWQNILSDNYTIDYLIVAGGGGGGGQGSNGGGGGGAGGYLVANGVSVASGSQYSVTVGAGGAVGTTGSNGANSSFYSQTSVGGGGGGTAGGAGNSGGSGGGRGRDGGTTAQTNGIVGQGNPGGAAGGSSCTSAGGGGGAGQSGYQGGTDCGTARTGNLARGGDGLQWVNGTYYAGGGGGAWEGISTGLAPGGLGGGGSGGSAYNSPAINAPATAGTTNTGGGGGGGQQYGGGANIGNAGAGGSGVVIIRYLGSQRGTGGTVTSIGGYTYHTFTGSGTFIA